MKRTITILLLVLCLGAALAQVPTGANVRKDALSRRYVYPKRIVWVSHDTLVENREALLRTGPGQSEFQSNNMAKFTTTERDTASILLDYGQELHGGVRIFLGPTKPWGARPVRVRFGESVSEAMSDWDYGHHRRGFSTNDHGIRDMNVLVPSQGMAEYGQTGFRFVRIDFLQQGTVHVSELPAVLTCRDEPWRGSFTCSDTLLNDIWRTGAWTVQLCMQDYLWDGIKRDRTVWIGDMHPETATVMSVFGYSDVVPQTLRLATRQYPLPQWLNSMSSYSMWFLIIMKEWYMHQGDRVFLKENEDYIAGLVRQFDRAVDGDGHVDIPGQHFLDWPSSPNKDGVEAGYRALLRWALRDAAFLCRELGRHDAEQLSLSVVQRLDRQIPAPHDLKQAAALMALCGWMQPAEACQTVIAKGGAKGFSTFYGYYMLQAMAKAGRVSEALDIVRQYWGGMLQLGATTFWEDFDVSWLENAARIDELMPEGKVDVHKTYGDYCYPSLRHSLCHGWASGVTPWLTGTVLGVEIQQPGCKVLTLTPHLGDLIWAEGIFPTPQGGVWIRHERGKDGRVKTAFRAPEGIKIIVINKKEKN